MSTLPNYNGETRKGISAGYYKAIAKNRRFQDEWDQTKCGRFGDLSMQKVWEAKADQASFAHTPELLAIVDKKRKA